MAGIPVIPRPALPGSPVLPTSDVSGGGVEFRPPPRITAPVAKKTSEPDQCKPAAPAPPPNAHAQALRTAQDAPGTDCAGRKIFADLGSRDSTDATGTPSEVFPNTDEEWAVFIADLFSLRLQRDHEDSDFCAKLMVCYSGGYCING